MVPEGWNKKSLSDVTAVIDCKHRTPIYVEAGIPLVSPGTIRWGALDLVSPIKRVSKDEYESLMDHCTIDIGDLVMSRNQSVGIASYIETDEPFVLGQDTVLIKPQKIDSKFVFYKLQSEVVQRSIIKLAGGSTFSRINLADIRKLKFNVPPLPEQKKIAQILSTWDKAITTTEQLLANSQQQKKALMQQLLTGRKRLQDKNGARFSGEWQMVKISSVCNVRRGASPRPIKDPKWFASDGRGWIRISDVTASPTKELLNTTQYLSSAGADNSVCVDPGDLIMSICGTIGVPKVIGIHACIHDGFVVFRECQENLDLSFLYHYLGFITEKLASGGQPGTQKNLNTGIVGNTLMPWVSKAEQQKIATVLSTADQEISALQQKLDALKQEKKALMQQLLTGKRRVKVEGAGHV